MNPENTGLNTLKKAYDTYVKLHEKYRTIFDWDPIKLKNIEDVTISDANQWGNQLKSYLERGYSLIGSISIYGRAGVIQFLKEGSKFTVNSDTDYAYVGHWVTITGISDTWSGNDTGTRYNISDSKWIRLYNPFSNRTEYYWWGDLMEESKTSQGFDEHGNLLPFLHRDHVLDYKFLAIGP